MFGKSNINIPESKEAVYGQLLLCSTFTPSLSLSFSMYVLGFPTIQEGPFTSLTQLFGHQFPELLLGTGRGENRFVGHRSHIAQPIGYEAAFLLLEVPNHLVGVNHAVRQLWLTSQLLLITMKIKLMELQAVLSKLLLRQQIQMFLGYASTTSWLFQVESKP